jgi:hypothetical protein
MPDHDRARAALGPLHARISRDYPSIEWATVNSQHDVAHQAPQELVAAVRKFSASA